MNRRLLALDLALLASVIFCGVLFKQRYDEAHAREMRLLQQRIRPIPAPAVPPLAPVPSVPGGAYVEVADKMLFSRDRNANIIVDPPPPPPPSPLVPPLPRAHGVIQFGDAPMVILSESSGGSEKSYRPGDDIGPFKLLDVNTTHILFEWKGLRILRTIEEITDTGPSADKSEAAAAKAAASVPETRAETKPAGPTNVNMGDNSKACAPNDNSPAGTVVDGMRKVVTKTAFGQACRWVVAQ